MNYEVNNKDVLYLCYFLFGLFTIIPIIIILIGGKITDVIFFILLFSLLNLYIYYFIFLQHAIGNIFKIKIEQGILYYSSVIRNIKVNKNDIQFIKIKTISSWVGRYDIIIIKLKKGLPIHLSMQEVNLKNEIKIKKAIETYLMPFK